ncbi:MAG TPA: hypothetical protein VHY34_07975 [Caulobacteraceae bacterium]|nr:hypothetical protein [Caulobacteraceae bacterium]
MRAVPVVLLAGVAAIAVAGVAVAQIVKVHEVTVRLPDGGVEEIHYFGDVAPQVFVSRDIAAYPLAGADAAYVNSPFAQLQWISAEMDREAAAMVRHADMLEAEALQGPDGLTQISADTLPAGTRGISYVSTVTSDGVCVRSMQITSTGDGHKPRVLTRTSGQCGNSGKSTATSRAASHGSKSLGASPQWVHTQPRPEPPSTAGLLHPVADQGR